MAETAAVKQPKRKRRVLRRILTVFIILALAAGAGIYAYSSLREAYTTTYTGYTASIGSISNALSFSGSLSLIDSQTYAAETDATVRTVYVQAGDQVQTGDKLVRLSGGETVRATFDGRVNSVKVEEGDTVSAGAALVQVADFSHLKASIRVDEYDISDVYVGQKCTVTATSVEKSFESQIAEIDYISASAGSVAYYTATVYVDVDEGVYPGMQATVSIPQEEAENVVVLKEDAISFDENNSAFVYMYDENQELVKVSVEVGVSNGNYVEIKSGLSAGDEVYAEVEVKAEASGLGGLMSSLFGGQQVMPGGGRQGGMDFGSFSPGDMPGGNDGNWGMPGSFGGGNQ